MIKYHYDVIQGTDEWLKLRMGLLTASEMKKIITPAKLGIAANEEAKKHYDDILGQRIDPSIREFYMNDDMLRGHDDEPYAVEAYEEKYGNKVDHCGFITNTGPWGTLGYSPDGLIGDNGLLEIKSKSIKLQTKLIMDHIVGRSDKLIPDENMLQCQTGLFVTEREWIDFVSYCNGHPMATIHVEPIEKYQDAIRDASIHFEETLQENKRLYFDVIQNDPRITMTEFREIEEMHL